MTMQSQRPTCDEVQMAALARLDGEAAHLTAGDVDAHVASCAACQEALAGLTVVHAALDRADYERLDVDLWPTVRRGIAAGAPPRRGEIGALVVLAAALVAWRFGQLVLEWPAPVVNSIVPFALVVMVLWRLTGDPFAIRDSSQMLRQEGM
jgi:hypothetical protein